jgi:hypothetical protein
MEELGDATFELVRDLTIRADLWDRRADRHLRAGRMDKWKHALERRDRANTRRERWLYGERAAERFALRARADREEMIALLEVTAS